MLMTSKKTLISEAAARGYRPEILEKVYRLLDLLEQFMAVPYLKERLVLKGGTAINLFCTDQLPRLSIDLDFNYVGSADRETMRQERPQLEAILLDICQRQHYSLYRNPRAHAGGKMVLVYDSLIGNKGRLEVDLNYIFRVPLWSPVWMASPVWPKQAHVTVLDIHELAVGKLHALLGREVSRDLFDSHQLLTTWPLDPNKLRLAFTVYAGMERDNWQRISVDNIAYTVKDIRDKLIPVLKRDSAPKTSRSDIDQWAKQLVIESMDALSAVLPFQADEKAFLDCLQTHGEIKPELISDDEAFCWRVKRHPSLLWRSKIK